MIRTVFAAFLFATAAVACTTSDPPAPPPSYSHEVLTVACGMCQLKMANAKGPCFWATEIDGVGYPIQGDALPRDHENHGPTGMCNMPRKATITGEVRSGALRVTEFTLLPAGDAPDSPKFSPSDQHK